MFFWKGKLISYNVLYVDGKGRFCMMFVLKCKWIKFVSWLYMMKDNNFFYVIFGL